MTSTLDESVILGTHAYLGKEYTGSVADEHVKDQKRMLLDPLADRIDEIPYRTYVRVFKSSESYEPVPHADEEPYGQ